jgi:Protein of unknown function (DUF3025)
MTETKLPASTTPLPIDANAWPPWLADDPRFAAVSDLLRLWPAGALPSVAQLQDALGARLADHDLCIGYAPSPPPRGRRRKTSLDPLAIYEIRIAETGEIPTRPDNLHDVCNALSWAAFPRAKSALTRRIAALQRAQLAATGALPAARTREHDRLALLDEGGLLLIGKPGEAVGVVVGHALWQHAALGHRDSRAATVHLAAPSEAWPPATHDAARDATDAAWLSLVLDPDRLHAAMADRAGEPIDEARLWRPAS